ncbi:MAG: hypothetical protein QM762_17285 [Chryseolinea sp.]
MRLSHCLFLIALASIAGAFIGSVSLTRKYVSGDHGTHQADLATKAAIMKSLDDYMDNFNAHDLAGWEETYHFPHFRLASGKMSVLEKAGTRDSAVVFGALHRTGWHHSRWEHRNIIHVSPDKVHVDTQFSRFNSRGQKLGVYESLYILTKENGHWGVKMRSSYAE